ncbi:putative metalloprotease CJM1_0395 family protein [Shewanella sp. NIFS-20-20]|uniref:putative metalloprotease CJM1_0395 family protein n=1 Tax=Shewanella sp. NIFS-20-20 TaxID=2853806 RepID=UPI001C4554ED|nr:putative metalloprotease CJM1_0395 family protein [Shewanella sp. NIFS-20-20]MBV7316363.1 hypothetical protein [Shewanella sp. NIFS-20-20]
MTIHQPLSASARPVQGASGHAWLANQQTPNASDTKTHPLGEPSPHAATLAPYQHAPARINTRAPSPVDSEQGWAPPSQTINLRSGASSISGFLASRTSQPSSLPTQENGEQAGQSASEASANPLVANDDPQTSPSAETNQSEAQRMAQENGGKSEAELQLEQVELSELQRRDLEVRQHEQAHAAIGGQYAGSPNYQFEQGSDGRRYAVEGHVQIDVSVVKSDPQATIKKMQQVHAAALAPVEPSMADIQVASLALRKMQQARQDLASERQQTLESDQSTATVTEQKGDISPPRAKLAAESNETDDSSPSHPPIDGSHQRRLNANLTDRRFAQYFG